MARLRLIERLPGKLAPDIIETLASARRHRPFRSPAASPM